MAGGRRGAWSSESLEAARKRVVRTLGVIAAGKELADTFHRTRPTTGRRADRRLHAQRAN